MDARNLIRSLVVAWSPIDPLRKRPARDSGRSGMERLRATGRVGNQKAQLLGEST